MKILLVGLGVLGIRHLQSISKLDVSIDVLEISKKTIDSNIKYIDKNNIKKISLLTDYDTVAKNYDICIIATSSKPRLSIIKDLQDRCSWNFLILEKFLFPYKEEFFVLENLYRFDINKVFINCPRRYYSDYIKIKRSNKGQCTSIKIIGNNWGLGTNGIHFLDLHRYFTGECIESFSAKALKATESKRNGYSELSGEILFKSQSSELKLTCAKNNKEESFKIIINFKDRAYEINEIEGSQSVFKDGLDSKSAFNAIYQSNLTEKYIKDLKKPYEIKLPKYKDAMKDHLVFLESIKDIEDIIIT